MVGVPAKDYIFQSANFLICVFALLGYAGGASATRRWRSTLGRSRLALLFLANIFFVIGSRTSSRRRAVLLLLLGWREFGWRGLVGTGADRRRLSASRSGSVRPICASAWTLRSSSFRTIATRDTANSTGLHLEILRKSLSFIEAAPIIGHGTGSIPEQFRHAAVGQTGASAELSENPHNQIFAVAIQLGIVGAAVLLAMWLAHLLLFCGGGLIAWFGLMIVVQNVVSSLFNSHLFDFTSGWLYVFGVGVVGGMVLRKRDSA